MIPNEYTEVEHPLITQLQSLGWQYLAGDPDVPYLTERQSFREVLLSGRLRAALRRLNLDATGQPWLDERRITTAVAALERLGAARLLEANVRATDLLLRGTTVEGDPARQQGREQRVYFIDFEHPERNDFLVINQFRVDVPGGRHHIIPDAVLLVNGIPLVVVECKSPAATDPMESGITQLLRYSNQHAAAGEVEGAERLFHYNLLMVATFFYETRAGTVGASPEHYLEWKDTSPVPAAQVAADLGVERLSSQQLLVAGMLRPAHLLDLLQNFTLFQTAGGQTAKIVARYQQFRAVHAAIGRLRTGQPRAGPGTEDGRGGIIWHTQGSGKSFTMVFLVRKLRTLPDLRRFKVIVVTDRTDLEKQLSDTAILTDETPRRVRDTDTLQAVLREAGPDLVFAMIQKYQQQDDDAASADDPAAPAPAPPLRRVAEPLPTYTATPEDELFPVLNESAAILVLVDEAHRSQANVLHANLLRALPNCARIGFTGTPILMGHRKRTEVIFGPFLDRYTLQQSEQDRATVPILYEGRTAEGAVADGRSLDQLFEDMLRDRTPAEWEAIKRKYATLGNILEAPDLIAAKARDMLHHYVSTVLPNRLKAQLVASSRLAAVRYQAALTAAHRDLLARIEGLDPALLDLDVAALAAQDAETRLLIAARPHLPTIRRLEFAAMISGRHNDPPDWRRWSTPARQDALITRFKKPLVHADPALQDGLAFLCVKNMLLTGFDAPLEQVLYLDRFMQGHELLQAIARVNRTAARKTHGLVVDYYGVGRHLKAALAAYSADDVRGVLTPLRELLPVLADRHRRVLAVFHDHGIPNIEDVEACVNLLRDLELRRAFVDALGQFLESLDLVLPRPQALPYVRDAQLLGFINKAAANLYRDADLNLLGVGNKVRQLIDQHIIARSIDPQVPPISILDADFAQAVDAHPADRTKASEMEHATRYHISTHYQEDPVYYKKLSQRLEEILQHYQNNWAALVAALRAFTHDVAQGRPTDRTGLDARTQVPFLSLLLEETGADADRAPEQLAVLAGLTVALVDHIRQEIRRVDFWRNLVAQNELRGWIGQFLDDHDVVPFARQQAVADRLVELARALHTRLSA